jgi:hypothetical protein
MDIADAISQLDTEPGDRPRTAVVIERVDL